MVKTGFRRPSDFSNSVIIDIGDPYPGRAALIAYYPNLVTNLKTPGLMMWGSNNTGQLGLGNMIYQSSPIQVGSLTNWQSVSENFQLAAIKTDGTLWSCGYNNLGSLGLGNLTWRSSPVQVGSLTNWQTVSVGNGVAAVKTDGTLWTWGYNYYGQLGLGDAINRSSPVQVGLLTNWKSVSASQNYIAAIKTNGTLWSWGLVDNGKLGLAGNAIPLTTSQSSPVQVGLLTNWKSVSTGNAHIAAIKTDGTLWTWGWNFYGNLGLGDSYVSASVTNNRSSPAQVGGLSNWQSVSSGYYHTAAIDTVGRLWTWGYNFYGQLGLGDSYVSTTNTRNRSSPVQVGSLTNWQIVASGQYHTSAIKTDGTLWTWGRNIDGQLGLGNVINRSSPVQVGILTNWKIVASGGATVAIVQGTDF